jgi:hypothetical protein
MYYRRFQLNIYKKGYQKPRVIRFYVLENGLGLKNTKQKMLRRIKRQALAHQKKMYPQLRKRPKFSSRGKHWISGSKPDYPVIIGIEPINVGDILILESVQNAH